MKLSFEIAETNNRTWAWINEGFVDIEGYLGCEHELSNIYDGEWVFTGITRRRYDDENEKVYYKEYKFIIRN